MDYRLGQFGQSQTAMSPAQIDAFVEGLKQAGGLPQAVERLRGLLVEGSKELPELRTELSSDTERWWLDALHDRLAGLERTIEIQILECSYQPGSVGYLCVAGTSPSVRAEVRPGDVIQAGFIAFRSGAQPLDLSSRVYRVVCANGSVERLLDHEPAVREAESIGAVLDRCLDSHVLREVAGRFTEATMRPAPTKEDWLDLTYRLTSRHGAVARGWLDEARELLDEIDEPTEWDFINALTEVARELPDWRERYDLEETAGQFARLRRPAPLHVAGNVELVPS